jgi:hypothetical protein
VSLCSNARTACQKSDSRLTTSARRAQTEHGKPPNY